MRVAVFTARSTGIGIVTGVLVMAAFGQFVVRVLQLSRLVLGLHTGALAVAGSISSAKSEVRLRSTKNQRSILASGCSRGS